MFGDWDGDFGDWGLGRYKKTIAPIKIKMAKKDKKENKQTKFYISRKSYFLTYPQCSLSKDEAFNFLMDKFKPKIIIIGQERHKDGNLHLHIWLEFGTRKTIRNCRVFDINNYHCNIGKIRKEECNNRKNAYNYIIKQDKNPLIYGIDIIELTKGIRKKICQLLINKEMKLIDIIKLYPQELYYYDKIKNNLNLYNLDNENLPLIINRKCYWIYGPSGVGKSYLVRECFDSLYEKSTNIWWDGYKGEDAVLIDDYDKFGLGIIHFLKIWADNYRFNAEIKGGMIQPGYTKLIITSNYSIQNLVGELGNEMYDAIRRRFNEIYMTEREEQEDIIIKILNLNIYYKYNNLKKYLR